MSIKLVGKLKAACEADLLPPLTNCEHLVLWVICDCIVDDTGNVHIGKAKLATYSRVSLTTLKESIRRLQKLKLLRVLHTPGSSNIYVVTLPQGATTARGERRPLGGTSHRPHYGTPLQESLSREKLLSKRLALGSANGQAATFGDVIEFGERNGRQA